MWVEIRWRQGPEAQRKRKRKALLSGNISPLGFVRTRHEMLLIIYANIFATTPLPRPLTTAAPLHQSKSRAGDFLSQRERERERERLRIFTFFSSTLLSLGISIEKLQLANK